MTKPQLLKILNPILGLSFLFQIISIVINKIGIWYEFFDPFHEYNGYVLIALVLFHFYLNWNWIKATFFARKK